MIVDFHTHCFPDTLAAKALAGLAVRAGGIVPAYDGTVKSLQRKMESIDVDLAVVLSISTNPKQQQSVNDFAIKINALPGITAFGSVHPDSPDCLNELERIKLSGLKGVKFHPDYQNFFVDDKKLLPIYEKIADLGLVTVFHSGVDIGMPDPVHCTPHSLKNVLPYFKGAVVVAAHMGGYLLWREVIDELIGTDIYIDTAHSFGRIPPPWAREIIIGHGANRILLGSDMPWSTTQGEIALVKSLGLSKTEEEMILGGNAMRLLGIK